VPAVARRSPVVHEQGGEEPGVRRHRPDYWILLLTALLLAVGIIVVFSISPALAVEKDVDGGALVLRQVIAIGIGLAAFIFMAQFPYSKLRSLYVVLLVAAGIATIIALLQPTNPAYPAHRWMRIGGLSFQSVELLKFALIIWLGGFLAWRAKFGEMADFKKTLRPLLFVLGGVGVVVAYLQSDLGSMGVIIALMSVMAFVAGLPMGRVVLVGIVIAAIATLAIASSDYRRARLDAYLNPESSCLTTGGYQACQARVAIGTGGLVGLGLGNSVQAYGYLPEAENDSIFAIYAEKFGLIGCTVLLGLFLALFSRMKRIAERAPDDFSRLAVIGIVVWLSTQTLINIGAMIGLLPLKGITLPLISSGGSSVIIVMAALGLVFQISRYTMHRLPETEGAANRPANRGGQSNENSSDRRRLRGAYHPNPGSRG
jgi:cell division protein FtsW